MDRSSRGLFQILNEYSGMPPPNNSSKPGTCVLRRCMGSLFGIFTLLVGGNPIGGGIAPRGVQNFYG
jgi:hypothetical protein